MFIKIIIEQVQLLCVCVWADEKDGVIRYPAYLFRIYWQWNFNEDRKSSRSVRFRLHKKEFDSISLLRVSGKRKIDGASKLLMFVSESLKHEARESEKKASGEKLKKISDSISSILK